MPPDDPEQPESEEQHPSLLPTAAMAELSLGAPDGQAVVSIQAPGSAQPAAARHLARLTPGERLANRFRIVRFIAKGGMGEVYEAEDEVVRVRLALKTILPAIAAIPEMVEQLKLEMRSARRVTHANVCRLIEIFEDRERKPPLIFLTMELVEGESLAELLRREGPLPLPQFYSIAAQVAAGLDAVHRADLVHQDLKTANVLLVKSAESSRAVVTDFGLAMNVKAKGADRGLSGGTPAYMAPEQVDGSEEITAAADIYAFGVVLYELLTNRFPIAGSTRSEILERKRTERPIPPSHYRPGIPGYTERAILRCLEPDPQKRFSNVTEALAAIEGQAERRRRKRFTFSVAAIALIVAASFGGYGARRWLLAHRTPAIAVATLRNSGNLSDNATATELTELLTSNLALSKGLTTIPSEDVALAQGEFPVTTSQNLEHEDLGPFRRALGSDYLVIGSYAQSGGNLSFDLKLQRSDGSTLQSIHEEGAPGNVKVLTADAASRIRTILGTQLLSDRETEEAENVYPQSETGRRLYFEALSNLRALNPVQAAALLTQAVASEPDSPSIHAAYAEAFSLLRNVPSARKEAERAAELAQAGRYPPEFVALTEARSAELHNDWPTAIRKLDGLFTLSREKLHFGLLLADAQTSAGQPADALESLARLSKLPAPAGTDPRIQIAAAETYSSMGNYAAEITAAQKAIHDAQARSWRSMEAKASLQLCWAYQRAGDSSSALAHCNTAHKIFSDFGDGVSGAVALNNIANWMASRGQYEEARDTYERVLAIVTRAQSQRDMAGAHLNLARTLFTLGDPGAAEHVQQAISLASACHDLYDESRAHLIAAELARGGGHLNLALEHARTAQSIAHDTQDEDTEGYAWNNIALYSEGVGDIEAAFRAANNALEIRQRLSEPSSVATTQALLGDLYFQRGDLESAKKQYDLALKSQEASAKGNIAQLQLSLAEAERTLGHLQTARDLAGNALAEFENEKDIDSAADANAVMVRIFTALKDLKSADAHYRRILDKPSQDHDVQLACAIAVAEFWVASNDPSKAMEAVQPFTTDDKSYPALEARFMLGRAQLSLPNHHAEGIATLRQVTAAAEHAGYRRLASEAAHFIH